MSVVLPKELHADLEAEARSLGTSIAEVVRTAAMRYFMSKGSNEPYVQLEKVDRLLRESSGFLGWSVDKFVELAKERGLVGDERWSDAMLAMVRKKLDPHYKDSDLQQLSPLDISRARLETVLYADAETLKTLTMEKLLGEVRELKVRQERLEHELIDLGVGPEESEKPAGVKVKENPENPAIVDAIADRIAKGEFQGEVSVPVKGLPVKVSFKASR